jgi:hypothetical protein
VPSTTPGDAVVVARASAPRPLLDDLEPIASTPARPQLPAISLAAAMAALALAGHLQVRRHGLLRPDRR